VSATRKQPRKTRATKLAGADTFSEKSPLIRSTADDELPRLARRLAGLHDYQREKLISMLAARDESGTKSKVVLESVGKNLMRNFWLNIGFSRVELNALRKISEQFVRKPSQPRASAAKLVIATALMHWDKLKPLALADEKYAHDEGFACLEFFQAKTIATKFNLPSIY
jgi:hypothetical protein